MILTMVSCGKRSSNLGSNPIQVNVSKHPGHVCNGNFSKMQGQDSRISPLQIHGGRCIREVPSKVRQSAST